MSPQIVAYLVGFVIALATVCYALGFLLGRWTSREVLKAYAKGVDDERRRTPASGGPCWVRGQVPPQHRE